MGITNFLAFLQYHGFYCKISNFFVTVHIQFLVSKFISSRNKSCFLTLYLNFCIKLSFLFKIRDDRNFQRRFRLSNFQRTTQLQYFKTCLPLCMEPGWNEMYFDLTDFTRNAYGTNYVETTRLKINANCRIRVIYFADK